MAQDNRDGEARRQEFVDTAERLFRENGIMETTVSAIVKELDVAKGLFYYYFRSKEDVIDAISEKYIDVFRKQLQTAMDVHSRYEERLAQYTENTIISYRGMMQNLQTDSDADLSALSSRSLEEAKYTVSEGFRRILEEGDLTPARIPYYADLFTAGIEELVRKNEASDKEIRDIVLGLAERTGNEKNQK